MELEIVSYDAARRERRARFQKRAKLRRIVTDLRPRRLSIGITFSGIRQSPTLGTDLILIGCLTPKPIA